MNKEVLFIAVFIQDLVGKTCQRSTLITRGWARALGPKRGLQYQASHRHHWRGSLHCTNCPGPSGVEPLGPCEERMNRHSEELGFRSHSLTWVCSLGRECLHPCLSESLDLCFWGCILVQLLFFDSNTCRVFSCHFPASNLWHCGFTLLEDQVCITQAAFRVPVSVMPRNTYFCFSVAHCTFSLLCFSTCRPFLFAESIFLLLPLSLFTGPHLEITYSCFMTQIKFYLLCETLLGWAPPTSLQGGNKYPEQTSLVTFLI